VLLVKTVLRRPHRTALTLCIAFFIFNLSLSVYFMARAAFGLSRRAALIAAPLYALHQDFWFWREARPLVFGFLPTAKKRKHIPPALVHATALALPRRLPVETRKHGAVLRTPKSWRSRRTIGVAFPCMRLRARPGTSSC